MDKRIVEFFEKNGYDLLTAALNGDDKGIATIRKIRQSFDEQFPDCTIRIDRINNHIVVTHLPADGISDGAEYRMGLN